MANHARPAGTLERHLHANGTRIIKFLLHLSKEEQRKRFIERIDDPHKNWKFSAADHLAYPKASAARLSELKAIGAELAP